MVRLPRRLIGVLALGVATACVSAGSSAPLPWGGPVTSARQTVHATEQPCEAYSPIQDAGLDAARRTHPGGYPPDVIQKLVRSHFGILQRCYEEGLRRNRNLAGKVITRFVIGLDGAVTTTALQCTSMPDDLAVDCVVNEFGMLKFPAPEAGIVTVIYPIMFSPTP
jgi:hypothetical protein